MARIAALTLTMIAAAALAGPARAAEFTFIIGGTVGLPVNGECTALVGGRGAERASFETRIPHSYVLEGDAVSCLVRKTDSFGQVTVTLQRAGKFVTRAETSAGFGWVEVRSDGPWGRASGVRGDPPLLRTAPTTGRSNRLTVVPPLPVEIPPPLQRSPR